MGNTQKFSPPSKKKNWPLDSDQTKKFYNTAKEMSDVVTELCGRTLIDFGLRNDELVHSREDWIGVAQHPNKETAMWYIEVPRMDYCNSGAGKVGKGNTGGADLHNKNQKPCFTCRDRTFKKRGKERGKEKGKTDGWVTEDQIEEYNFFPKSENSASKTWAPPTEDGKETAKKFKRLLEAHGQFPVLHTSVGNRVKKIKEEAGIDRKVTVHALRHTYGTRLAGQGQEMNTIMKQMRHGDISMTQWYIDIRGQRQLESFERNWNDNSW